MFISNAEDTSDVEISSDDEETLKQALADAAAAAAALHPTGATTTATAAAAGTPAGEPTEYVKSRPRRQAATRAHMGSTTESLDLTVLHHFVGPVGGGGALSQPFSVSLSPEAALVMDFHAHLSACEVIGLLGGAFDEETRSLEVKAAFPCRRAAGSDSGTSVELDAESQVEVTTAMAAAGLSPVGWYHSHPVFEPRPSAKDNENQRNYQALCRSERSGLEPWVGAIVGPYDQALPSGASGVQLWVVRQRDRAPVPFNVRANRDRMRNVPLEGDDVETQLMMWVFLSFPAWLNSFAISSWRHGFFHRLFRHMGAKKNEYLFRIYICFAERWNSIEKTLRE
jgi:proteasome lid subunit RPN8/RPN11